jgi:gliding motility-associated-like protein
VHPVVSTTYRVKSIKLDNDGFACETILEYTVAVSPFIKPEIGDSIHACTGDTITLDGGDYRTWEWSNNMQGRSVSLVNTTDPLILTVTDINGCSLKDTVAVHFNPLPEVELGTDRTGCSSSPLLLSGGTGGSYLWSTGAQTPDITVAESGRYRLTITTNGCSSTDSVNVKMLDFNSLSIDSVVAGNYSCYGSGDGSIEVFAKGTGSSYLYSIDGDIFQPSNRFNNLPVGDYHVSVWEDSLCLKAYAGSVRIRQPDSMQVSYLPKSPSCETCSDGQLTLEISGGTKPYDITLSGASTGLITEGLSIGPYTVLVTDANHCSKSVEFTLEILNRVPNVLTTNNDGINDLWKIPILNYYPEAVVKVFTTTGKLVFESPPDKMPWNGRYNGIPLPMGTYYYLINLGTGEKQLTGYLTILR